MTTTQKPRPMRRLGLLALALALAAGCGGDGPGLAPDLGGGDVGRDDAAPDGSGRPDGALPDGPAADARQPDGGGSDPGGDQAAGDAPSPDGRGDTAPPDAGVPDAPPGDQPSPPDGDMAPDARPGDLGRDTPDGVGDTGPDVPPGTPFWLTLVPPAGESGPVVVQFRAATGGGEVVLQRTIVAPSDNPVRITGLPAGAYGLTAWLDGDGDGQQDGIWEEPGEPTAILGLELPRPPLTVPLRRGWPAVELADDPAFGELYDAAWQFLRAHVAAGTRMNGFAAHYLDEAFSAQIFQWDTCFMTMFGRLGVDAFPVMPSLDNFYAVQGRAAPNYDADDLDGYICRVVNESDGQPGGGPDRAAGELMLNPPLFAWAEWLYVQQTGDRSRLPRVVPHIAAYHDWIDRNARHSAPDGTPLYYQTGLGSGMDNAPRDAAHVWVDMSAQQALGRRMLGRLYALLGRSGEAEAQTAEAERLCGDIRRVLYDAGTGFFFDLDRDGRFLADKTLASVWPLVAGCATADQSARVVAHLHDPAAFWRLHVFASTEARSPAYDPDGFYWRGGVWAPTNYATVQALEAYGRSDLARAASENHLTNLYRVFTDFAPEAGDLAPDATGPGTTTLWELYAPDRAAPGRRWDNTYLGRQDFVGWSGLGPIALLVENVIGLEPDAPADTLTWRLTRTDRHGVAGYRFGDQLVDLQAEPRATADAPATLRVTTSDAFRLVVVLGDRQETFAVAAGTTTLLVDAAGAGPAARPVPAGPFPGYAVLGNGRVAAAWSDDNGQHPAPGLAHLYVGHFGRDLVRAGVTRVATNGTEWTTSPAVGLDPFFAAYASRAVPDGSRVTTRAFVGAADAVLVQGLAQPAAGAAGVRVVPQLTLRDVPHIDGGSLESVEQVASEFGPVLAAHFRDGEGLEYTLALAARPTPTAVQTGPIDSAALVAGLNGAVGRAAELALQLDLTPPNGGAAPFTWVVAVGPGGTVPLTQIRRALAASDPLAAARDHWQAYAPEPLCGRGARCELAAANLYAARASSLAGRVPADLTGQFLTNGYPQLYPRDALMVARALIAGKHADEAHEIVADWLGGGYPGPAPGAFYARYDARGRAVAGGSGAAYDVPEWDSNGYLALLVEAIGAERFSGPQLDQLFAALDYLVTEQDATGLFREGGIVECAGRLSATAMTSAAGLDAGQRLARARGDAARVAIFRAAAGRIRGGLRTRLLDLRRLLLADEHPAPPASEPLAALLYNTSALFGPALGYPAGPLQDATYRFILDAATTYGGGVRYFEPFAEGDCDLPEAKGAVPAAAAGGPAAEAAKGDYGQDLFFFTTSAAAQYALTIGDDRAAANLLTWMASFTNRYGLAPERIYDGGAGAAPASPLSWCAAEFAYTLLAALRRPATPTPPLVDGTVTAAEYRPFGPAAVDHDGLPDTGVDPVALYAVRAGETLYAGLTFAGPLADFDWSTQVALYLADAAGEGAAATTPQGAPLTFRSDPARTPGAALRLVFDPVVATCTVEQPGGAGFVPAGACTAYAFGAAAVEVALDPAAFGLVGPLQLIAAVAGPGGEALLPAHGSLASDGTDGTVLVTFEVDAGAAPGLDPDAGTVVTLSGDRVELGAWQGDALALYDDGSHGDRAAGDGYWTRVVRLPRGGEVAYKYLVGRPGDGSWAGVEFEGDNRTLWIQDADRTGRVHVREVFGQRGGALLDP